MFYKPKLNTFDNLHDVSVTQNNDLRNDLEKDTNKKYIFKSKHCISNTEANFFLWLGFCSF